MRRGDSVELEGKDDRDRSDRICCSSQVQLRTERELVVTYCIPPGGVVGTPPSLRRLGTYRGVELVDGFGMR
jgi:hypothetical protein